MLPVLAFVAADLIVKKRGKHKTTSQVGRENKLITAGLFAWGIYHIYLEDYEYLGSTARPLRRRSRSR